MAGPHVDPSAGSPAPRTPAPQGPAQRVEPAQAGSQPVRRQGAIRTTLGEELPVSLRGPRVLTLIGTTLLVLGVALGVVGLVQGSRAITTVTDAATGSSDGTIAVTAVPGSVALDLEAGSTYGLLLVRDGAAAPELPVIQPEHLLITATAPDGTELQPVPGDDTVAAEGLVDATVIARYTAATSGVHTVDVSLDASVIDTSEAGPERADTTVVLGPDTLGADLVRALLWLVLGPLVGFGAAGIGFFMGAGGAIWWGIRAQARRAQRARMLPA